tara:strand:+ start:625 stop:792 length:168 start_codon:yes stop_codon:yes gene_type:complete
MKKHSKPSPVNRLKAFGGISDARNNEVNNYRDLGRSGGNPFWCSSIQLAPQKAQK